jgi:hypothetical protein
MINRALRRLCGMKNKGKEKEGESYTSYAKIKRR